MKIRISKLGLLDMILIICSFIQLVMLFAESVFESYKLCGIIHMNLYIIIFSILINLVFKGIARRYLCFSFFLCFFIFLMGQKIFMEESNVFLTFVRTELNSEQYLTFLTLLSLAIILTYYAYFYFQSQNRQERKILFLSRNYSLLNIVRTLYFTTLPFALYMQVVIVIVKSSLSYTGGYLINIDIPIVVRIANYIFSAVIMVYLAIKPPKKEMIFILFSFLIIYGSVQIFQGRRALFATTLLFIVWYLIKYYDVVKIRKKYWIIGVISMISVSLLFFVVEQQRSIDQVSVSSIFDIVKDLMISTGGSDSVIANTIVQYNKFPVSGIFYLINPIINNPITNILTGKMGINQGYEYIENFNSFSHELSYMTERSLYLAGYGMGASYVAEVYLSLGIIGVCVVSILLGKVISTLENINLTNNVFVNASYFILVKFLFILPRSELFSWVSDMIYLLFVFFIIYPFYKKDSVAT